MASEYVENRVKPAIAYGAIMYIMPLSIVVWGFFLWLFMSRGAMELSDIVRKIRDIPQAAFYFAAMPLLVMTFTYNNPDKMKLAVGVMIPMVVGCLVILVYRGSVRSVPAFLASVVYVGLLPGSLLWIRVTSGYKDIAMVLAVVMMTDIFAYELGKRLKGKGWLGNKPFQSVSPNKTVGGYISGTTVGVLVTFVFLGIGWLPLYIGLVLAMMTHLGDALESAMKRTSGIKDSGTLFRDHGGVLDRVDGLIIAAPMGLFLISFFQL